ncbi:MAG: DedA family protein [Solirubrobacterales bacterium]|nr:DedA family protein [Solirubrobacterales bacterium]
MLVVLSSLVIVFGSITDPLVEFTVGVVGDLGLWGIFILMAPESACIPIPSEGTMLFAGFAVSDGRYSLWAAVLVASFANLVGSWVAYAAGYYGRTSILEKHAKKLHIKPSYLTWADRWFEKYGDAAVFFSRMLPIVRTFISLPAGVARMPILRFSVLTFAGAVPWNLGLTLAGREARDNWTEIKDKLHYVDYLVAFLIVVAAIYFLRRFLKNRDSGSGGEPALSAA